MNCQPPAVDGSAAGGGRGDSAQSVDVLPDLPAIRHPDERVPAGGDRRAARPEDADLAEIDRLYAVLKTRQLWPVVTLNRAGAVDKIRDPAAAARFFPTPSTSLA